MHMEYSFIDNEKCIFKHGMLVIGHDDKDVNHVYDYGS